MDKSNTYLLTVEKLSFRARRKGTWYFSEPSRLSLKRGMAASEKKKYGDVEFNDQQMEEFRFV